LRVPPNSHSGEDVTPVALTRGGRWVVNGKGRQPSWQRVLGRYQRVLGLLVAFGGAIVIWRWAAAWSPAWPLGFLLAAAGLYLMRTAPDEDD